ncbi:lecithin retinol acyltransferase [Pelobates cultripes]|uniref:Lecithin retinol acyltransferase n=1 Tax=Pelobates cultripes TaxID=61616 RepID=A0AAD1WEM3_PELCU|nr:lecithin retinol acyltransferase [Pelobates cultripes]
MMHRGDCWTQGEAGSLSYSPLEENPSLPRLRPSPAVTGADGDCPTILPHGPRLEAPKQADLALFPPIGRGGVIPVLTLLLGQRSAQGTERRNNQHLHPQPSKPTSTSSDDPGKQITATALRGRNAGHRPSPPQIIETAAKRDTPAGRQTSHSPPTQPVPGRTRRWRGHADSKHTPRADINHQKHNSGKLNKPRQQPKETKSNTWKDYALMPAHSNPETAEDYEVFVKVSKLFQTQWYLCHKLCGTRADVQVLKLGDLLEVPRTLFIHFGIYLGDNQVAHLIPDILPAISNDKSQYQKVVTNTRLILGVIAKVASVRVDALQDFAYGGSIIVNQMDQSMRNKPLSNEEVAQRAEQLMGDTSYSLLWDNCEHFVTYCRYGIPVSIQTEKFSGAEIFSVKTVVLKERTILLQVVQGKEEVYLGSRVAYFQSYPCVCGNKKGIAQSFFRLKDLNNLYSICHCCNLKRGDLFEVPRTLFIHYGIYLGNNKVAHLMPDILPALSDNACLIGKVVTNKRLILGVLAKVASVRVDTVQDFAYGGRIIVNHMDNSYNTKPYSNEDVALRAEKLVGATSYSLLWDNCEHFVTYCRYGIPMSFQTEKISALLNSSAKDYVGSCLACPSGSEKRLTLGSLTVCLIQINADSQKLVA